MFRTIAAVILALSLPIRATIVFPFGDLWSYTPGNTNIAASDLSFYFYDDSGWASGYGPFGNGFNTVKTSVSNIVTLYFRKKFNSLQSSSVSLIGNVTYIGVDGAVLYLNGLSIGSVNMPTSGVTNSTLAVTCAVSASQYTITLSAGVLLPGDNIIAAELHSCGSQSLGAEFDLSLTFTLAPTPSPSPFPFALTTGFSMGSTWQYLDDGTDQTLTNWKTSSALTWPTANAPFGIGTPGVATTLQANSTTGFAYPAYYFRRALTLPAGSHITNTFITILTITCTDGAVITENSGSAFRINLVTVAAVTQTTLAASPINVTWSNATTVYRIPTTALIQGNNVITVELHQASNSSATAYFDASIQFEVVPSATPSTSLSVTASYSCTTSFSPSFGSTETNSPTSTGSITPSSSSTGSAIRTYSKSLTATTTVTPTITRTYSPTKSSTQSPVSVSSTRTSSVTVSPTATESLSTTDSYTPTPSVTPSDTATSSCTSSGTASTSLSPTVTPSPTESRTHTVTVTPTGSITPTESGTTSPSPSFVSTNSASVTQTGSVTKTDSPSSSVTSSLTETLTSSASSTVTSTVTLELSAPSSVTSTLTTSSSVTITALPSATSAASKNAITPSTSPMQSITSAPAGTSAGVPSFSASLTLASSLSSSAAFTPSDSSSLIPGSSSISAVSSSSSTVVTQITPSQSTSAGVSLSATAGSSVVTPSQSASAGQSLSASTGASVTLASPSQSASTGVSLSATAGSSVVTLSQSTSTGVSLSATASVVTPSQAASAVQSLSVSTGASVTRASPSQPSTRSAGVSLSASPVALTVTPSPVPTSPSPLDNSGNSNSQSSLNTSSKAGVVVAGIVGAMGVVVAAYTLYCQRLRKKDTKEFNRLLLAASLPNIEQSHDGDHHVANSDNCSDDDGQRWLSSELKSTIGDGIRFAEISEPLNMVKPASGSEQECVTEVIAAGTTVGQSSLAAASDSSTVPQQQPATRIDPQAYDVNPQDDGLASHAARASTVPLDPMQALGHTNSPTPFPYSPVPLPSDSTSQLIQAPLQSPDTKPSSRLQPYHHPAEAVSYSKFQKDRRQTSYGDLRLTAGVTSRRDTSHGDVIVNGHGGQHSRPLTNHSDKQHATVGPGDDTIGLSAVNKEKYVLHPVPVVAKPAFHSFTASIATSAHTLLPSSAPSNNVTAPTVRRTQRLTIESLLSEGVTIAPVSMAVPSAEKKRLSRRHTKKHKRYTHRKKSLSPLLHSWPHSGDESEVTSAYFSSNPVYPQQLSSLSPQRYFRSDAQSTGGQPSQAVSSGLDYLDV